MSQKRERWADGAFVGVNCASEASLADVRAPRGGARTFSKYIINIRRVQALISLICKLTAEEETPCESLQDCPKALARLCEISP